ncbi:hypothetical protein Slin15195_G110000 [Septoria linicola]|uniref:Uncharacterized protein n=1 Tax=Septoria linicola TaxID=215465 RepID=A0A9Q9B5T4_9PEZI|nr:hypothetical protein Slin14017_G108350 [Septoria linicola]USW57681.1 hypothetical protein Slin15195_G110000 [Septoria linicola]
MSASHSAGQQNELVDPASKISTSYANIRWTLAKDKNILLFSLAARQDLPDISDVAKSMKEGHGSTATIGRIKRRYVDLSEEHEEYQKRLFDYPVTEEVPSSDGVHKWTQKADRDLLLFGMENDQQSGEDLRYVAYKMPQLYGPEMTEENIRMRYKVLWREKQDMERDYNRMRMERMYEGWRCIV